MNKTIQDGYLKYVLFVAVILLTLILMHIFKFPVTPSIDKSVLVRDLLSSTPIAQDDYVLFTQDHELLGGEHNIIKKVGCVSGQRLERRSDGFYCDGEFLKVIRLERVSGEPLPQFHYSGVIPQNQLFVYGTDQYSFGSRHWGFLDASEASRLIPII